MTQIFDANRYIARILGDEAALEEVEDGTGVALNQPSGIFWEHAWEMLIPMKQTGSGVWQKRMYRAAGDSVKPYEALSNDELDALIKVSISLKPGVETLTIIAVRLMRSDLFYE